MSGKLILVLGGCRSGKSAFALRRADELASAAGGGRVFIATCPAGLDAETRERIRRHREERRGRGWQTVEEETDLPSALARCAPGDVALVDCLTLWVNNLMHHGDLTGKPPGEEALAAQAADFADAALARQGATLAVANEVGLGVAPDNALARRFRDLAGRVNQVTAARADEVFLLTAGLPQRIK